MNTPTELVCQSWPMPEEPTADSVARVVKSLLMLPVTIKSITIDAPTVTGEDVIVSWEAYVPTGVPPDSKPKDAYNALLKLNLIELTEMKSSINPDALQVLINLLAMAQKKRSLVGVGILVGNEKRFRHWAGMENSERSNLLNMPIIELDELPDESVVLLCGKGVCDPLEAVEAIVYRIGGK